MSGPQKSKGKKKNDDDDDDLKSPAEKIQAKQAKPKKQRDADGQPKEDLIEESKEEAKETVKESPSSQS